MRARPVGHDRTGRALRLLGALAVALALVAAGPAGSFASSDENEREGESEGEKPNHLTVFTGLSFQDGFRGAPTIGLDYEYRFTYPFGVGALIDYAGRDFREFAVAIPFVFHPADSPVFYLAPGLDRGFGETEFRALLRIGFLYDFDVSHGTIAPAINLDFVEGGDQVLVIGLNTGRKF